MKANSIESAEKGTEMGMMNLNLGEESQAAFDRAEPEEKVNKIVSCE
ncbi:MAG: hypothetical protein JEZ12_16165 [Desulfobacterium sp.]|nr:hypothetical protein [Desulfobacterium sp.]